MISVIVPTYNRANVLKKSIDSILKQTYADFELIIVDDGSSDNTEQIVKQYDDLRIRYVYNDTIQHGPSIARNIGIRESRGEYIAFNDSDDEWNKEKLEKEYNYLLENNGSIVFCMMGKEKQLIPPARFEQKHVNLENILSGSFTGTPAILGKRECFEENQFDELMSCNEDWELLIRLINQEVVLYLRDYLVNISVTEGSVSSDVNKAISSMNYIMDKHADKYKKYGKSKKKLQLSIKYQEAYKDELKYKRNILVHCLKRLERYWYALRLLLEK